MYVTCMLICRTNPRTWKICELTDQRGQLKWSCEGTREANKLSLFWPVPGRFSDEMRMLFFTQALMLTKLPALLVNLSERSEGGDLSVGMWCCRWRWGSRTRAGLHWRFHHTLLLSRTTQYHFIPVNTMHTNFKTLSYKIKNLNFIFQTNSRYSATVCQLS